MHLLGLTAYEEGRPADAVDWFGKAAHADPAAALYATCLGAASRPPAARRRPRRNTGTWV